MDPQEQQISGKCMGGGHICKIVFFVQAFSCKTFLAIVMQAMYFGILYCLLSTVPVGLLRYMHEPTVP